MAGIASAAGKAHQAVAADTAGRLDEAEACYKVRSFVFCGIDALAVLS